jgi:hemoglobin-like flavoprotein
MKAPIKIPKVTNAGSSSSLKHFLLSLLATTISIVLTFGTSAFIEKRQKKADKREMVMMIIYDFDKTIEQLQQADSVLQQASSLQLEIALHPESYDSLRFRFTEAIMISQMDFSETTEKIFSSNIETFNTLGNVNFVHEVSSFYNLRQKYQEDILNNYKETVIGSAYTNSVENLFKFDFPDLSFSNKVYLHAMQKSRNLCMKMMDVSEKELKEFSQERMVVEENSEEDLIFEQQVAEEYIEAQKIISQAKEKLTEE